MVSIHRRRPTLLRRYRSLRSGTCSTNVRRWHEARSQKNRRTLSQIANVRPTTGRSATRRTYRE